MARLARGSPARRQAARWLGPRAVAALGAGGCLLAGCASPAGPAPAPAAVPAAAAPLATSIAQADGRSWAIVPMGAPAGDDTFWELFTRPAGGAQWTLATPPGVADNGGLVAAATAAAQGLDVAVRPSQSLTFSPLALTGDGGKTWDTGLLDASVAADPDALALGGGRMLALLGDGAIDQAAAAGPGAPGLGASGVARPSASAATWTRLAAPGAIAASAAGRACHVTGLTAVSLTAAGTPLAAASCARPGMAGIFAPARTGWRAAGPALAGRAAGQPVKVLRLTRFVPAGTGGVRNAAAANAAGNMALLQAGTGATASLLAAWSTDGTHWTVSPPLPAGGAQLLASGAGPAAAGAWVLLAGGRAETVAGPGAAWRVLPAPPRGTTVLASGPSGTLDALAASGGALTVYQLTPAGGWRRAQVISVPVQYGSSS